MICIQSQLEIAKKAIADSEYGIHYAHYQEFNNIINRVINLKEDCLHKLATLEALKSSEFYKEFLATIESKSHSVHKVKTMFLKMSQNGRFFLKSSVIKSLRKGDIIIAKKIIDEIIKLCDIYYYQEYYVSLHNILHDDRPVNQRTYNILNITSIQVCFDSLFHVCDRTKSLLIIKQKKCRKYLFSSPIVDKIELISSLRMKLWLEEITGSQC